MRDKLDKISIDILRILQLNGRISNLDLSKVVGITPSPCLRRIGKLEKDGYIDGYYADINADKFGYVYKVITILSLKDDISDEDEKKFIEMVNATDEFRECYQFSSKRNYIIISIHKDNMSYRISINKAFSKLNFVDSVKTIILNKQIKNIKGFPI